MYFNKINKTVFSILLLHVNHVNVRRNKLGIQTSWIHLGPSVTARHVTLASPVLLATVCCSSVHCFLKKLQLGFCDGAVLGCSSRRFLKSNSAGDTKASSYWHNWELKNKMESILHYNSLY